MRSQMSMLQMMYNMTRKKKSVNIKNAEIVKREAYVNVLKKITKEGMCPFCEKHLMKHHPNPIIFKGNHWLVTENGWPYEGTKQHFLLIPRKHIESIEQIKAESWSELQRHLRKLQKEYPFAGGTFFIRSGDVKYTGATVQHLHANVVVGKKRNKITDAIRVVIGFKKGPSS